jgi:putative selenate reductase
MDCAHAAKRNKGVEKVSIVYRRTKAFMPAQREEIEMAQEDGVEIIELHAPESFSDGKLICEIMELGDYGSDGRQTIKGTGKKETLSFDTVIGAVGAQVDTSLFAKNGIELNSKGFPKLNKANETSVENVYIAGDCKTGPATVVKGIADGKIVACNILEKLELTNDFVTLITEHVDMNSLYWKKGVLIEARNDNADAYRCLSCNKLCEICCDVCPNRANVAIICKKGKHQSIHIDRLCNECGNCAVFCPHDGKPYTDKFTVFSSEEDFKDSKNRGFLLSGKDSYTVRLEDGSVVTWRRGEKTIPAMYAETINVIADKYSYLITEAAL